MENLLNYPRKCWNYIIYHHWSKDILRANILYIFLADSLRMPGGVFLLFISHCFLRKSTTCKFKPTPCHTGY